MKQVYFITGTDTNVGKTLVSCALLQKARAQNLTTLGLKPVAAGATLTAQGLRNSDAQALQDLTSEPLDYAQINPICLPQPIAPHLAAIEQKTRISLDRLVGMVRGSLMSKADFSLVEGAGGWRVPINERDYLSALPIELKMPVILVVGLRLGCINHALLTMEAIARDGLPLVGWVANQIEAELPEAQAIIETLNLRLGAPCLGHIPFLPGGDFNQAVDSLQLPF
ncbi:MAG: dethiobiotin synthase [Moraxellaceae bacterium]|nr:MAG: dethiobiotin synthase [Moraxellaceae bacterium]